MQKAVAAQEKQALRLRAREANTGPPDDADLEMAGLLDAQRAHLGCAALLMYLPLSITCYTAALTAPPQQGSMKQVSPASQSAKRQPQTRLVCVADNYLASSAAARLRLSRKANSPYA